MNTANPQRGTWATKQPPAKAERRIGFAFLLMLGFSILLSGVFAALLPVWVVSAIIFVPAFLVVLYFQNDFGLLAVIALVSGLIHPAFAPSIGPIKASDMALAAVLLVALVKRFSGEDGTGESLTDVLLPFWTFIGLLGFSVVIAIAIRDISTHAVLGEARDLGYLLLLPATIWVVKDQATWNRLSQGILVLGLLFSFGQILQGLLDIPVFGEMGRLETLQTLGHKDYGVTRTLTRGIGIIEFSLLMLTGRYLLRQTSRVTFWFALMPLAGGIVLTFGRTTFATTLIGLILVASLIHLRRSVELFAVGAVGIVVVLAVLSFFRPSLLEALTYRITGTSTELSSGASAQWRYYEAQTALPQIQAHPIFGIGLGADYRPPAASDVVPEQTRYIHNAYLYMADKMGLPALAVFLWLMAALIRRAWRAARHGPTNMRPHFAATAVALIALILASITEPHFMADYSLALIGLLGGLLVAATRLHGRPDNVPAHSALELANGRSGRSRFQSQLPL